MTEPDFLLRFRSTGRNDDCPCGSGKKYKKCHLREDEEAEHRYMAEQEQARAAEVAEGSVESSDTASSASVADHSKGHKGEPRGGAPRPEGRGDRGGNIHVRQQGRTGR